MDQNQWNALNQMLSRQTKTSSAVNTVKAGVSSGDQNQSGTVSTRVILAGSPLQQRSTKQLNGAQQNVMETGGTGVVKSLLTGRQYAQSVLRTDVGRGQNKPTAAKNPGGKQQVSVLQPNWQQTQQNVDVSAGAETQQLVLTGLPENIGPGESLYVVVDGVTYQIDSSNAELLAAATGNSTTTSGASVVPIGSRMSLEDLANIRVWIFKLPVVKWHRHRPTLSWTCKQQMPARAQQPLHSSLTASNFWRHRLQEQQVARRSEMGRNRCRSSYSLQMELM